MKNSLTRIKMPQSIHLIFKTHLDVGFTDFASTVLDNYFKKYIPSALRVAREMRESQSQDRFLWTTGSFLIYEFLEQANAAERKQMEEGILAGDIAWHALAFTTHTELMDPALFEFGLSLSQELDARFGRQTIAAKMTDVPGHTRGIIPLLAQAGVKFLHIGVNPASTVPGVPPLFRWQDPSGTEIVVMYESGYGTAFTIAGLEDSLAFGHTGDNLGPQSPAQVLDVYHEMHKQFPGARVFASTLDAFAARLTPIVPTLPVVTQEIGDTWIHGVGSDPIKVSQFKELCRLRAQWIKDSPLLERDPRFKRFSRRLLMVPEHTWGTDEKTYLGDHENYSAVDFQTARQKPNFQKFQRSWVEKRRYPQEAVNALEDLPQAKEARHCLAEIRPIAPQLSAWRPYTDGDSLQHCGSLNFHFSPVSGALDDLEIDRLPQKIAGLDRPLGWLRYQTFSAADYDRFFNQYIIPSARDNGWALEDFTKPGLETAQPLSRFWQPGVVERFVRQEGGEKQYLFHLTAESPSQREYGCPRDFWLNYHFAENTPEIKIELQWFHKQACRMPEALWFSFSPVVTDDEDWCIEKMGREVSPQEVVPLGNRHLHASGKYVAWRDASREIRLTSLDAPLVCPGSPSLLNFTNDQPQVKEGMHINLLNNLWGTNFPMWFEEDCRFRFTLSFAKTL
jgi:hypothetical protein